MSYRGSIDQNRLKNAISSVHKGRTTDVGVLRAKAARSEAKLFNKLHEQDYAPGKQQSEAEQKQLTDQAILEFNRTRLLRFIKAVALVAVTSVAIFGAIKAKAALKARSH